MSDEHDARSEPVLRVDEDTDEFRRRVKELMPGRPGEMFHAPLGEFLLEFNEFEIRLSFALQQLSRAHPSAAGMLPLEYVRTVFDRVKLLRQMAKKRFPKTKIADEADRIYKTMRSINSFRNALVHGQWKSKAGGASGSKNEHGEWNVLIQKEATIIYFDASGEGEWQIHRPTPEIITQKTVELRNVTRDLFNLSGDIYREQRRIER